MTQTHCPHCGGTLAAAPMPSIIVDTALLAAFVGGATIPLTPKPAAVLDALVKAAPNYVKTAELTELIWGNIFIADPEGSLRVHIAVLRKKLKDHGFMIDSRQFHGYRLVLQ
jgi:DNA-binding response OmpR family regulator